MPFTLFHLGPALLIGLLLLKYIDFPTFLIANVIVDLEPFLIIVVNLEYPLHGFFHSFLGGTIIAIVLTFSMIITRKFFTPILSAFKIEQEFSFKNILPASILGIYIHILLDSPIYTDIHPFFPLKVNPFYDASNSTGSLIIMVCIWCFIAGIFVFLVRLAIILMKDQRVNKE
ncbi:MAG: hypothetical protein ACFFBE_16775 [Promethearchaeota archaeon]